MDIPVRSQSTGLNLTPLIDIVFLLLVFFLLTTHFIEEDGIGVRLPAAASTTTREKDEVAVAITRDGRLFVAGQQVHLSGLEQKLRGMLSSDTAVVIRGDRDVPLQTAVSVMEQTKKAGAARIVVATLEEAGAP
ncbi:biopolymer transport membrane protein, TolR-related protein [Syntrophotalea carbinolica DSM 2380]|uniref:Biopolymer transport membrane protein, TolR-related protein n=1 Tax=Syntrophotalea carbinolica (strain DSM 2380 / NBRC 103641 / GraBd1) TaxID=338963 RepID=Q3A1X8_SYNC1|nr:biopolymer transporter ExbD [Syntrophotalea carbinolica]ABA89629.1 biopolymer transport membrane protein, TolR-related protein [Syntrophotalea carbinolica DSM 2380]